jgi:hypothetical protein
VAKLLQGPEAEVEAEAEALWVELVWHCADDADTLHDVSVAGDFSNWQVRVCELSFDGNDALTLMIMVSICEVQSCWGYNQGVYNQPPPIVKAQRVPRFSEGRYQGDIKGGGGGSSGGLEAVGYGTRVLRRLQAP